jgi:hypothetical protein
MHRRLCNLHRNTVELHLLYDSKPIRKYMCNDLPIRIRGLIWKVLTMYFSMLDLQSNSRDLYKLRFNDNTFTVSFGNSMYCNMS